MKSPKQSDQQMKYYALFHTFMCIINKQYNFGGTSTVMKNESQSLASCRGMLTQFTKVSAGPLAFFPQCNADTIYKGFCWVLGIFSPNVLLT